MDFSKVLNDLRRQKTEKIAHAQQLLEEGKVDEAAAIDAELDSLCKQIATTENLMHRSQEDAEPLPGDGGVQDKAQEVRPFHSLGEQLQAVVNAAKTHTAVSRIFPAKSSWMAKPPSAPVPSLLPITALFT